LDEDKNGEISKQELENLFGDFADGKVLKQLEKELNI
jgi:hypothetical protein